MAKKQQPLSNLTPETFLEDIRAITLARREKDEAVSKLRHCMKRAEAHGVDLKALALHDALHKLDDGERAARLRKVAEYAAWRGVPVGGQAAMFESGQQEPSPLAALEHAEFCARQEGVDSGRTKGNRTDDNPHAAGTALHVQWDDGWTEGAAWRMQQDAIAAEMGGGLNDGPKRKPGRPRRSENPPAPASAVVH